MRLSPEIGIKSVAAIYTRPAQAGKSAGSPLENLGAPSSFPIAARAKKEAQRQSPWHCALRKT